MLRRRLLQNSETGIEWGGIQLRNVYTDDTYLLPTSLTIEI